MESETKCVRAKIIVRTAESREIRRISVTDFSAFVAAVERFTGTKVDELTMEYVDLDGDMVRFSTSEEFEEMKEFVKDCSQVKIRVTGKNNEGFAKKFMGHPRFRRRMGKFGAPMFVHPLGGRFHRNPQAVKPQQRRHHPFMFRLPFPQAPQCGPEGGRKRCHLGIICDGCGKKNWRGRRFKCLDCPPHPGYDLCGKCHKDAKEKHDPTHNFQFIPLSGHFAGIGRRNRRCRRRRRMMQNGGCCWRKGCPAAFIRVVKNEEVKKNENETKEEEEVLIPSEQEAAAIPETKEEMILIPDDEEEEKTEETEQKEEKEEEKFVVQMKILKDMGFTDFETNFESLEKFGGDIKKTVEELIRS